MTQNKMTVTHVWAEGKTWNISGTGYEPSGDFTLNGELVHVDKHPSLQKVLLYGALCNTSTIVEKDGEMRLDGDPTEGALLTAKT
ncbi:hypothetical protein ACEQPO_12620 [Bacillus sp. SL00103]